MRSASFHGPSSLPAPQVGLTSEITSAERSPNGPHAVGAALSPIAPPHEKKNAITAREMVLFTAVLRSRAARMEEERAIYTICSGLGVPPLPSVGSFRQKLFFWLVQGT